MQPATDIPSAPTPSRLRRWLRRLFLLGLAFTLVLGVAAGVGWWWLEQNILSTLPKDLSGLQDWRPPTVCTVVDRRGEELDSFYLERRVWVELDTLPDHVWQAFVAAEDRRFFEHSGVDPAGIARAIRENLSAGSVRQGGSTITQQLVKNLLVGRERSYKRKLREAILAYRLERELTKEQILELFVNYVFLGSGNYGVEAAAQDYFGIPAVDLDPGQAAMIAGLVPAPSRYNPRRSPELAAKRRELVLLGMAAEEYLHEDLAISHMEDPVLQPMRPAEAAGTDRSYVTMVRRELRRTLPPSVVFDQGLIVTASIDTEIQAVAEKAVHDAVLALEQRQGGKGPHRTLDGPQQAAFLAREVGPPAVGDCFEALVGPKHDLAALQIPGGTVALIPAQRAAPSHTAEGPVPLHRLARAGAVLHVCLQEDGQVSLEPTPFGQAAAVVLDHRTGQVLALAGGWEVGLEGFVRATQARRQPGSSFKPYVYAAALLRGRTQLDTMVDGPLSLPAGGGKIWSPRNYGGGYAGSTTLRSAMARSLNTIAVRLVLEAGPERVARLTRELGVTTPVRHDPTIALGSSEVTPMDQAVAYATIARMGVPTEPVYIDQLVDFRGEVIGRAGEPVRVDDKEVGRLAGGPLPRVLPPAVAYELADMLREVVRNGTARRAHKPGFDRAGKTGTTNDFIDAWFVGFTPRYVVAVWVGTDGTVSLGPSETGGRAALPAWITLMEALPHQEGERLPIPDDAVLVEVGGQWMGFRRGAVPTSALSVRPVASSTPLPPFAAGTQPPR